MLRNQILLIYTSEHLVWNSMTSSPTTLPNQIWFCLFVVPSSILQNKEVGNIYLEINTKQIWAKSKHIFTHERSLFGSRHFLHVNNLH